MHLKQLLATAVFATLPLAAGFAYAGGAYAQGMQYSGPSAPVMPVGSVPQVPVDMTRQAALEQQVRDLTNQLEQRDFQLRQLQTAFEKFSADTNMRLQDLETKASGAAHALPVQGDGGFESPASDAPSGVVPQGPAQGGMQGQTPPMPGAANAPASLEGNAGGTGALSDPNGAFQPDAADVSRPDRTLGQITESGDTGAGKADAPMTAGKPQKVSAPQAYDRAFSFLQQNNYADAQKAFLQFLKDYPTNPLAANAQYWLGESYFAQTQYTLASKTFAKAYHDHPQGQKAPDALLKLALTLEKLNKKDDACLTLKELGRKFTTGPASVLKRAADEGKRMGCAG